MDAELGDEANGNEPDTVNETSASSLHTNSLEGVETPAVKSSSALDSLFDFFLLSEDGLDELNRITGLLSLLVCWHLFKSLNWLKAEYQVETWWWQDQCLALPDSESLAIILLCLCSLAGAAMLVGVRGKLPPLLVAGCIAYITSLDANLAFPHSFFLTIWICVALVFRREGRSASRRLIQLSVFACYFLSGLQKLFTPQFISGHSLEALIFGNSVQNWVFHLINQIHPDPVFWKAISILVVVAELLFSLGLWHRKTQIFAVAGIIVFQSLVFATMDPLIAPLHLTVFAACIAFVNPFAKRPMFDWLRKTIGSREESSIAEIQKPGTFYKMFAVIATTILFAIPLRIYFYPDAFVRMSLMDRRPWTFCMFVSLEGRYKTSIVLKRKDGNLVWFQPRGRMAYLSSDTDMLALAKYLEKTNPRVVELKIESQYDVNMTNTDHKVLTAKADQSGNFKHHITWRRESIGN
ncbi:MAG TPA: hypothetical protein EYN91_02320 [Candidatus Melainabacteria bacterium]|nr:hypothetical protein [Candidatus Melainabacteria bacterium]HIN63595.1 hypothetical protein [Candidatus Obscuribacterales bacterium]